MNDYAVETLDLLYDVCAFLEKASREDGETKISNLMTGACLMALLAKNHIKSELPKEMIAADYVVGAFDSMLNTLSADSEPDGYA